MATAGRRWFAGPGAGLFAAVMVAGSGAQAGTCPDSGSERVAVAAVEPRLELRLSDGRLLRLAGLDPALATPAEPDRDELARQRFADRLLGHGVTIQSLSGQADRWGRLAVLAIAAGLGRYRAEAGAAACRADLLAAEGAARDAHMGLWSDPYYGVLAIDDQSGFAERSGTEVVAEARLAKVEVSPYRTTLMLANGVEDHSCHGHLLSATILPRVVKIFESRGIRVASLVGRSLRLRGLLDLHFGPQIGLDGPDALEVLDPPAAAAPAIATTSAK